MGRNKNRNKLQLKNPSQLKNGSFSRDNSFNEIQIYEDENDFESSENILNNPILLNHINDIQNINESVLIWSNEDVIDENKSKSFHSIVKHEIIKKSIRKSAFSKYLKSQLKDINTIHLSAISGVLMRNEIESDKSSIILNEIPNNNYLTIESKKQSLDNKNVFDSPEEIENVDASCQQVRLIEAPVSGNEPIVRRSGRSAKINYKELLNVSLYEQVRLTDGRNSPKRKPKMKRESSMRQSASDNSEMDNHSPERKLNESNETEAIKCEITQETPTVNELKQESGQFTIEEKQYGEEKEKKQQHVDTDGVDATIHQKQLNRISNEKKNRKLTKDPSRNCIKCTKAVMCSRKFDNLCYNCVVAASKIITRLKLSINDTRPIVCLGDRGCWEDGTDTLPCEACRIQQLMAIGLQWGEEFQWMRSVTLDQLRSQQSIQQSRQLNRDQGGLWLEQFMVAHQQKLEGNHHGDSCLLSNTDKTQSACKWDIRYLVRLTPNGLVQCQFCVQDIPLDQKVAINHTYTFLPLKDTIICHQCLLTAHYAIMDSSQPADKLLQRIHPICPLEPLKYRYFDGSTNPHYICEICMRQDRSVISRLRSGNLVCLVCIWRIKRFYFHSDGSSSDENRTEPIDRVCAQKLDQWRLCPINKCDRCLKELAIRVIELHQIITHCHNPVTVTNVPHVITFSTHKQTLNNVTAIKSTSKSKKRAIEQCEDATESKPKRQCMANPLEINAKWTPIEPSGDQRPRRKIKSTKFNDFIVEDRCLSRSTNERSIRRSEQLVRNSKHIAHISPDKLSAKSCTNGEEQNESILCTSPNLLNHQSENVDLSQKEEPLIDANLESCEHGRPIEGDDVIDAQIGDDVTNSVEDNLDIKYDPGPDIKERELDEHSSIINNEEDCTPRRPPPFRRIKQAICTQSSKNDEEETNTEEITMCESQHEQQPVIIEHPAPVPAMRGTSGPRVKQVSRQNVNVETNLDSIRQKCVVKRANRIARKPESLNNFIIDDKSINTTIDQMDELEDHQSAGCDSMPPPLHDRHYLTPAGSCGEDNTRCGFCAGCCRNRCCGKCSPCRLNKSKRRKTELCVKMICTSRTESNHITSNRDKISDLRNASENAMNESSTDKSAEEITHEDDETANLQLDNVIDVYRDSDSDDLSSEEEQLDPELDSIYTVKGDLITTALAHEGGFPVITTVKAQPNKVLCFSCGSGGDQLIHCVSCAEPFHFFCIEYQFRPKSKEMFMCRNCTKCHSCDGYGSDLKCIKCQLGFHPNCVDKYPPTKSDDKSNWACYKCAMCLHCGAKAEDAMTHPTKLTSAIDWSKDPWQCGRCARARIDGHVCPECGRAYQAGLETIECKSCHRMVHRQCCGLTEDEYEIFKADPEANCSASTFQCTKCIQPVEIEEDQKKRVRLRRQCKDSGLKQYCERNVQRKMNEFIQKGETTEEMLLEQHNICDSGSGGGYNMSSSLSIRQYDGHDDEDNEDNDDESDKTGGIGIGCSIGLHGNGPMGMKNYDLGITINNNNSPSADMNQTTTSSSTVFYSSESTGECDMEPLNLMDLEHQSKVDVDVELENVALDPSRSTKIGIFSRLNASDFLSPKHLLMEALARICVKMMRYPSHSQRHKIYLTFYASIEKLTSEIFPWLDYRIAMETVQIFVKKYSGRAKLILQALAENVRDNINREFDVFSSSIHEIEEKLSNSFQRGREEFIIFHSEQHLSALMKSMEFPHGPDTTSIATYATYNLAFTTELSASICEKDVRHCALCGCSGDDRLEGRLIYGGLDIWVHVNCALWSDDVYEREDGALVNVDIAIQKGEKALCTACQKSGATLRCSAQESLDGCGNNCPNVYHFACAFNVLPDPVFTELRTFYCSESHDSSCLANVQQLSLVDMPILRRIYLPQGCLADVSMACTDGIASDLIVVTIGNLRIDCMGKIDECSDYHRIYLCPIGYQARRLFWSMHELDSLVMYFMSITKELNTKANGDEMSTSASNANSDTPAVIPHRRRMIEMPEQRIIKRPKPMQCRQDIIYEMDEAGNLQPVSGFFRQQTTYPSSFQISANDVTTKKVNRRFPINSASTRIELAQKSDLGTAGKCRIVSVQRPEIIQEQTTYEHINRNKPNNVIIKSHPITLSDASQHQQYQPSQPHQYLLQQPLQHQQQSQQLQPQLHIMRQQSEAPVTLRVNRLPIQPQRLPTSIVKQLNLNRNQSKPVTFINLAQPLNRVQVSNPSNNNNVYKIMKVSTASVNALAAPAQTISAPIGGNNNNVSVNQCIPVSTSTTARQSTLRIISGLPGVTSKPLASNSSSVLRTVLTDNSHSRRLVIRHHQPNQPVTISTTGQSAYHISSCGSIVTPTLSQFDGEADDSSVVTFDEFRSKLAQHGGSDQDNVSVITTATSAVAATTGSIIKTRKPRANHDYKFCVRFQIHGLKGCKSPKSGWGLIVKRVTQMRRAQGLMEYPVRNGDGWAKFGLDHRHVIYLVEQMVSAFQCNNYEFKFHKTRVTKLRNQYLPDVLSPSGCARFTQWFKTKPDNIARDALAFLHSKSNYPPKNHAPLNTDQLDDNPDPDEDYLNKLAAQFRNLHNGIDARAKTVRVCVSTIHGRGLFARRQFDAHEIIIEYVGEVIRSILSDVRETEYQKTGVDCYMFRLDQDLIVDATFKGNAARFINHSCHPNCYAKVVRFEGEKHIIIIAQRKIYKGEELTYDYRFPIEDDKLPCTCGSFSCKKYLN